MRLILMVRVVITTHLRLVDITARTPRTDRLTGETLRCEPVTPVVSKPGSRRHKLPCGTPDPMIVNALVDAVRRVRC